MKYKTLQLIKIHENAVTLIGCGLLILATYLKIPFYPVSFTMQTFVLFGMALHFPSKVALRSTLLFLILATVGLPVFAGIANPLWIFGKCSGFLIGFPIAVSVASYFNKKNEPMKALWIGHLILYILGFIGLLPYVNPYQALIFGILVFIPSDFIKAAIIYYGAKQ